ncbi:MAG TPA: peptidoglycan-binding domain-containing protein, partial [Lysobacter sp.]
GPSDLIAPLPADGPAMEWVRDRLAPRYIRADAPAVLDAAMREAVRRFQTERGLLSDGVIGPETLMALAAGDEGPQLQRALE